MKFLRLARRFSQGLVLIFMLDTGGVVAGVANGPTHGLYGTPGLIDMPTSENAPDASVAFSLSGFNGQIRSTLTFQILPGLSGSFRYSTLYNEWTGDARQHWDRSFDLRYQVRPETRLMPAISLGVQDFIGTGVFSGEYVVGTKTMGPLKASVGLGWGRYGSHNGFKNPLSGVSSKFDTRPAREVGVGGEVEANGWFRGDAAVFGGLSWPVNDQLTAKLEYSSDAYTHETQTYGHVVKTPWNYGATYVAKSGTRSYGLYWLGGSKLAFSVSVIADPKKTSNGSGWDLAPLPVRRDLSRPLGLPPAQTDVRTLYTVLKADGFNPVGHEMTGTTARLQIENLRYRSSSQAVGRAARIASRYFGDEITIFVIDLVEKNLPLTSVEISRESLVAYEFNLAPAKEFMDQVAFGDVKSLVSAPEEKSSFYWRIRPYFDYGLFDPDQPVRFEFGVALESEYVFSPSSFVEFGIHKQVIGNLDSIERDSDSVLPHVRSDHKYYHKQGDPGLEYLTLNYLTKPHATGYVRLTGGYLEEMYAGVSAEYLWQPTNQNWGLGIELNKVRQRDFVMRFGLRPYDVFTGHVSAYYDFGGRFEGQLDIGQYLAGDKGVTLSVNRVTSNGWRFGAWATLTDVPFETFGEGSFDKGLRVDIPLDWILGKSSPLVMQTPIQIIGRDGGARLHVNHRLYPLIQHAQRFDMGREWARFWR